MKSIKTTAENYRRPIVQKKRAAPHPLAACADEIKATIGFTKVYGQGYWLRKLSVYAKARRMEPEALFTELLGMLKGIEGMDAKYSKGGRLTNLLKV